MSRKARTTKVVNPTHHKRTRRTDVVTTQIYPALQLPSIGGQRADPHYLSRNALSVMMTRIRSTGDAPIKLLIVDKEPSVRFELTELCRGVADLQVLGEAE